MKKHARNLLASQIDEYIDGFPLRTQRVLQRILSIGKDVVPDAEEIIRYGVPTLRVAGKNVVHFGGFKNHVSLFPGTEALAAFKNKIVSFKSSKGTIQFPLDRPLPEDLIRQIIAFCHRRSSLQKISKNGPTS